MKHSLAVWMLVLALTLGACTTEDPLQDPSDEFPEKITGVLLSIESTGFAQVESFKLKVQERIYTVLTDPDIEYGSFLGHLSEHLRRAEPVTVTLDERDGDLYALTIEDG